MSKYQRMDANMFADYLYKMEDNTSVVFATRSEVQVEIGNVTEDEDSLISFYYAKKVYDEYFNSWYIVIDFISGGEAHVIALDWEREDDENYSIILESVQHFMSFWIRDLYVEIEPD